MGQVIPIKIEKTRAVVQSANSFGSISVVIWEYIANGIDYINKGTKPQMEAPTFTTTQYPPLRAPKPSLNCWTRGPRLWE